MPTYEVGSLDIPDAASFWRFFLPENNPCLESLHRSFVRRIQDHVFIQKSKKRLVMTKSVGGCGLLQDRLTAGIVCAQHTH